MLIFWPGEWWLNEGIKQNLCFGIPDSILSVLLIVHFVLIKSKWVGFEKIKNVMCKKFKIKPLSIFVGMFSSKTREEWKILIFCFCTARKKILAQVQCSSEKLAFVLMCGEARSCSPCTVAHNAFVSPAAVLWCKIFLQRASWKLCRVCYAF